MSFPIIFVILLICFWSIFGYMFLKNVFQTQTKYIYFVVPSYSVFFYSDLQVCCNEPLFLFVLPYNPACAWFTTFFCNRYWILRIVFGTLTVFIDHFRQYLRIPVVMFHYLFVLNYFICLHFGYAIQDPPMLFASVYSFQSIFLN